MTVEYMKQCAAVGLLTPDMTPMEAYILSGKILAVCERDLSREVAELQDAKKAEGDEDFFYYDISLSEFLEGKDSAYLEEVRRRLGA